MSVQLPNQRRDWNAYDANHIGAWKFSHDS